MLDRFTTITVFGCVSSRKVFLLYWPISVISYRLFVFPVRTDERTSRKSQIVLNWSRLFTQCFSQCGGKDSAPFQTACKRWNFVIFYSNVPIPISQPLTTRFFFSFIVLNWIIISSRIRKMLAGDLRSQRCMNNDLSLSC